MHASVFVKSTCWQAQATAQLVRLIKGSISCSALLACRQLLPTSVLACLMPSLLCKGACGGTRTTGSTALGPWPLTTATRQARPGKHWLKRLLRTKSDVVSALGARVPYLAQVAAGSWLPKTRLHSCLPKTLSHSESHSCLLKTLLLFYSSQAHGTRRWSPLAIYRT